MTTNTGKDFSKKNIVLNSIEDINMFIDILDENEQDKTSCKFSNDFSPYFYL
jgi:hypothetical protein